MNLFTRVLKPQEVNYQEEKMCLKEGRFRGRWAEPREDDSSDLGPDFASVKSENELIVQSQGLIRSAENEAAKIVAEAELAAKTLAEQAWKQLEDKKELAMQEAWQAGYQAGHLEGTQAAFAEAEGLVSEAKSLIKHAVNKRDEIIAGSQNELLQLAVKIAEKIMEKEVQEDPGSVLRTVRKSLRFTSQRDNLTLRVSAEDIKQLSKARLLELGIPDVKIVEDRTLRCGDCLLDGVQGRIDATSGSQLATVQKKLEVIAGG